MQIRTVDQICEEIISCFQIGFGSGSELKKIILYMQGRSGLLEDGWQIHKNYAEQSEFLGDRVLGLAITLMLEKLQVEDLGTLATIYNGLVSTEGCCAVGVKIGLVEQSELTDNIYSHKIVADAVEGIIAVLFKTEGFTTCVNKIEEKWQPILQNVFSLANRTTNLNNSILRIIKNSKSHLQEIVQEIGLPLPQYTCENKSGPDHAPLFNIRVSLNDGRFADGEGKTRKQAEADAAKKMIIKYFTDEDAEKQSSADKT